jgi:DNA-binding XRE family transcriptional regulator
MKTKKCSKCGSLMTESMIDNEVEVLGEKVVIGKVNGFLCTSCGNKEKEEKELSPALKRRILEKRLEIQAKKIKEYNPLIICDLRKERNKRGISQNQIGKALGVSEQRYGAIERSDSTPKIDTGLLLGEILGVDLKDIYRVRYVTKEFFDKIKNLKAIEKKDGTIEFVEIKKLVELTAEYEQLVEEIEKKMKDLREAKKTNKKYIKMKELTKDLRKLKKEGVNKNKLKNYEEQIDKLKKDPDVISITKTQEDEISKLKKKKSKVLTKKRYIERTENAIIRSSKGIDGQHFDILKKKYSKEYGRLYKKADF